MIGRWTTMAKAAHHFIQIKGFNITPNPFEAFSSLRAVVGRLHFTFWLLVGVVALGLFLRLGVLAWNQDNAGRWWGDSINTGNQAVALVLFGRVGETVQPHESLLGQAIIEQNRLVDPEDLVMRYVPAVGHRPDFNEHFGLGLITGALWWATGSMRFISLQALQLVLDVLCIVLVWYIARRLFVSPWVPLLAAGLYSVFIPQVYMVTFPFSYTWMAYYAVFLLVLLAVLYGRRTKPLGTWKEVGLFALIGLLTGLFAYIRANVLFMCLFLAAGLLLYKQSLRKVLLFLIVTLGIQGAVLMPLMVRNYVEFGRVTPTRGVFWHSVWTGFGQHSNPVGAASTDDEVVAQVLQAYPGIKPNGPEYEAVLKKWSIQAVKDHPFWFIRIQLERLGLVLWPEPLDGFFVFPLFALAGLGAWVVIRRHYLPWRTLALFLAPSAYFFLTITVIFVPRVRYATPGYVFLLVLAAVPLTIAAQRMSQVFWAVISHRKALCLPR